MQYPRISNPRMLCALLSLSRVTHPNHSCRPQACIASFARQETFLWSQLLSPRLETGKAPRLLLVHGRVQGVPLLLKRFFELLRCIQKRVGGIRTTGDDGSKGEVTVLATLRGVTGVKSVGAGHGEPSIGGAAGQTLRSASFSAHLTR